VDRKIREAIEAGAFDNLPNRGQQILLEVNPFEDPSLWMAHHLLRTNGFAPAWIEEARDIENCAAKLRLRLQDRSAATFKEFRDRVAELNRRIWTYNLRCPSAQFHKRSIDPDAETRRAQKSDSRV